MISFYFNEVLVLPSIPLEHLLTVMRSYKIIVISNNEQSWDEALINELNWVVLLNVQLSPALDATANELLYNLRDELRNLGMGLCKFEAEFVQITERRVKYHSSNGRVS